LFLRLFPGFQEGGKIFLDKGQADLGCADMPFGGDNNVRPWQRALVQAKKFAQHPFDAVPGDSVATFTSNRQAYPAFYHSDIPTEKHHEITGVHAFSLFITSQILTAPHKFACFGPGQGHRNHLNKYFSEKTLNAKQAWPAPLLTDPALATGRARATN
jgi:hypothetical protein